MANKALLVGINKYPGSPLNGCVNDIKNMAEFLVAKKYFEVEEIRVLSDERATTKNILERLEWLVTGLKSGDKCFFHFSGHGCFSGDTKIPLLDGTIRTLEELSKDFSNKKFWVYSCTEDGKIVPGLAHSPRQTKISKTIKIYLDNDAIIKCTEDHLFMLRDGTYKKAIDLKEGDSLMPLYREISSKEKGDRIDGYEKCYVPNTEYVKEFISKKIDYVKSQYIYTHQLVAYAMGIIKTNDYKGVTHHNDFCKLNNSPDNLLYIDRKTHAQIHSWTEERKTKNREMCIERNKTYNWPEEIRQKVGKISSKNRKKEWQNKKYRDKIVDGLKNSWKNKPDEEKEKHIILLNEARRKSHSPEAMSKRILSIKNTRHKRHIKKGIKSKYCSICQNEIKNHKVKKVEITNDTMPVFDITVDKYHNFALEAGVFVHNSQVPCRNGDGDVDNLNETICFTGDTKIPLLDGTEHTLEELAQNKSNEEFWVYSIDKNGNIKPGLARHPRLTRKNAEILTVTLDNGESVRCTPDHLWMLRNGEYKKAKDLISGDSLMPLYRYQQKSWKNGKKRYELVFNPNDKENIMTHKISAGNCPKSIKKLATEQGCGTLRHHINFNQRDNRPNNLIWMTWFDHIKLHSCDDVSKKIKSEAAKKMWLDPILRDKIKKAMIIGCIKRNENTEWKEKLSAASKKQNLQKMRQGVAKFIESPSKECLQERARKAGLANLGIKHKKHIVADKKRSFGLALSTLFKMKKNSDDMTEECFDRTKSRYCPTAKTVSLLFGSWDIFINRGEELYFNRFNSEVFHNNHKVISVEPAGFDDVYDLTVDKYENFAISAGVFVHNCPVDFDWEPEHMIIDKQFSSIFKRIPEGVIFNWFSDCCNSGDLTRSIGFTAIPRCYPNAPFDIQWRGIVAKKKQIKCQSKVMINDVLDVGYISGCKDHQTSADTVMNGSPCGAFTFFLIKTLIDHPDLPLSKIGQEVCLNLKKNGFSQEPETEGARRDKPFLK